MRVSIAPHNILRGLLAVLIMLNANLATNVLVSATSTTRPSSYSRAHQEIATTVDERPMSPRLATLRDQLKSGDRKALDNFWKEITESGAPIIERVPGNDSDMLVTMLWRAREETRNVFVFRLGDVSKSMERLLDTDLWYKTFRLQKGARFIYQLATNLPDPKEWGGITRFA
ncbi:MAG TPA: enterochelin esterase domain-containing protein, partial [Pyrinomonadaceae bacterium]